MTSNLGSNFKSDSYGFANSEISKDSLKKHVNESVKDFFSPEFLNRVDELVIFNKLDQNSINRISKLMLDEFSKEALKKGFKFEFSDDVIKYISRIGFDTKFGARPLRRAIQKNIEDTLAVMLFEDKIKKNIKYTVDYEDGKIVLK